MLITVTGPSGIGKGRVCEHLMQGIKGLQEAVWHTTRPLRAGEQPGGKRVHVSPELFHGMHKSGQLTLCQCLYGNWYGVDVRYVQQEHGQWLTELHVDNALICLPNIASVSLAIIPDSFELLSERLRGRGTESEQEVADRLAEAAREIQLIRQHRNLFWRVFAVGKENEQQICGEIVAAVQEAVTLKEAAWTIG